MRSSIWAKSWASTPPSLALICTMHVGVVVLAGEQAAQLEQVELLAIDVIGLLDLRLLRLVVDLAGQFVQHLGVVELLRASSSYRSTSDLTLA